VIKTIKMDFAGLETVPSTLIVEQVGEPNTLVVEPLGEIVTS